MDATATVSVCDLPTLGGLKPKVKSEDDANQALAALAALEAEAQRVADETAACKRALDDEAQRQLVLEVDGRVVPFSERITALETALKGWADRAHPELASPKGSRSLELRHGKLGYRKTPARVDYAEGLREGDVVAKVDRHCAEQKKHGGLWDQLSAAFEKVKLFARDRRTRTAGLILKLAVKVDRSAAKRAYEQGLLDARELKTFGLEFHSGEDRFFATPA